MAYQTNGMYEKVSFGGWANCIRLRNEQIELIVTLDVGPRIVRFGFIGKQNFFHLIPEHAGKTGEDMWTMYGGHRLWIAPENIPLSYYPDNFPVDHSYTDNILTLSQKEHTTAILKQMEITLHENKNEARVIHRLVNQGSEVTELSTWGLSVLSAGSRAIVPQEPYGEGDDYLLPARSMALWQYTVMNDPRWIWGDRYIQAKHDERYISEQKIGLLNKQQWTACYLNGEVFIKKFPFDADAIYPDFMSNNEVYINGKFLEIETLGPLVKLAPGETAQHYERWLLAETKVGEDERSITENILPLVNKF
jgi:hypothetical protein